MKLTTFHSSPRSSRSQVFDGLLGGSLPVYRGASSIDAFMPSSTTPALIKMSDFNDDMQALAEHLLELSRSEAEYGEYFKWKEEEAMDEFQSILDMTAYKYTSLCRVCERVAKDNGLMPKS